MYIWMKSLHIIAMVTWFAGLFYMFRLFVYHSENKDDESRVEMLKIMEKRLYYIITEPAMIVTWVFGLMTLYNAQHLLITPWFHVKLTLVLLLTGYHHYIGKVLRRFAADDVYLSSKQCRIRNEVPTFFLIAIVLLAFLKPF